MLVVYSFDEQVKILLLFSLDRDLRKRGGMIELPLGVFSWARSFDAN